MLNTLFTLVLLQGEVGHPASLFWIDLIQLLSED